MTLATTSLLLAAVLSAAVVEPRLQLASNGVAKAEIVIAADAPQDVRDGAAELRGCLERITGATFAVVNRPTKGLSHLIVRVDPTLPLQTARVRFSGDDVELTSQMEGSYAVYEFLKTHCGVDWLDPTDAGEILPHARTFAVERRNVDRRPWALGRMVNAHRPELWREHTPGWTNYLHVAYPSAFRRDKSLDWAFTTTFTRKNGVFRRRMRLGGLREHANHSFYWFYERFLDRKSPNFVAYHPEFFAKGWDKKGFRMSAEAIYSDYRRKDVPPQLCYSEPGVVRQVTEDALAYFQNGGYTNSSETCAGAASREKPNPKWGKDVFCLEPMDNDAFCLCERCQALYHPERASESAKYSDYWFDFVNKVARAVKAVYPDKKISTLAYGCGREGLPSFPLEDNVIVHFCYSFNRMPHCVRQKALQEKLLADWRAAYPKNEFGLWLYHCFPSAFTGHAGGWRCFPGFFGQTLADEFAMLRKLDVRRVIFVDGTVNDFESYLLFNWMWDPTVPYATLKDRYFRSYGVARKPLERFYEIVEERYTNPAHYPKGAVHQNEAIAWGYLGTPEVMKKLAACRNEAEAARPRLNRQETMRLDNWVAGIWEYMLGGIRKGPVALASGRDGVTVTRTLWQNAEPPPLAGDVLRGRAVTLEAPGATRFDDNGRIARFDGKGVSLSDVRCLTDGALDGGHFLGGSPSNVVFTVRGPFENVRRIRLTLFQGDAQRGRFAVVLSAVKDGRRIPLTGLVRSDCWFEWPHGWTAARGPVYGCYEFAFAPGSAPRSFDELRIEDRTTEQGWLPERLVQFELAE